MTHPTLNINTHCILICQSGENPRIKTRTNTERSYHDDYFQCKCCHSYFTTQMIEVGAKYTPLRVRPMTDFLSFFVFHMAIQHLQPSGSLNALLLLLLVPGR